MANDLVNMVLKTRLERKTGFEGTGTVYVLSFESEDKAFSWGILFGTGAPSTNFTDVPENWLYIDITSGGAGLMYKHTTADTWAEVGDIT